MSEDSCTLTHYDSVSTESEGSYVSLKNIQNHLVKQNLSEEIEHMSSIQYWVEKQIQNIPNSRVLKVKRKGVYQSLTMKITPKFQKNDSQHFHQLSQLKFLERTISERSSSFLKIKQTFFHNNQHYTLMEYICGGDLSAYIKTNSFLMKPEQKLRKLNWVKLIIRKIIEALEFIQEMGYVYRDLKPSNILVTHHGEIKLCDFGLVIQRGSIDNSLCGTPEYLCPERFSESKKNLPVQTSVDMWSLGILTYQLYMGVTPFSFNEDFQELESDIYNGSINFDKSMSDDGRNFIMSLLQINPKKRLTLKEAKQHKFLQNSQKQASDKWWRCECDQ